jgi:AraC-like DNA-binding protein
MRMTGDGTATFTNPDDYQASIGSATVNLVLTGGGDFRARLTSLNLRHLQVLRGHENLRRIAYVALPPERVVISFPASAAPLIWGGLELRRGNIVFHGSGERTHQWTTGESKWGLISLSPKQLSACSKALTGLEINSPSATRILQPSANAARLLLLHSKACRLAETRPEAIRHPEVARALEQEFLQAVVKCLTADDAYGNLETKRRHGEIMIRFEDALTTCIGRKITMPVLCSEIGVHQRTLRLCCTEFLGMSPARYFLLRRLNMARSALRRADPATSSVAEIARSFQFSELGRFSVAYRTIFGEMPSTTLRHYVVRSDGIFSEIA